MSENNPVTESTPARPTTPGEITGSLIAGMPKPTEQITDAASFASAPDVPAPSTTPAIEATPATGELIDSKGVRFNPAIHATNEDGTPKRNFKNNFYKRHGMGGSDTSANPTFAGVQTPGMVSPEEKHKKAQRLAKMVVPSFDRLMQGILTDGAALEQNEKDELIDAAAHYAESQNIDDIPPGVVLIGVIVGIYAEKLNKPTVKERLTLYWLKIRKFFSGKGA